MAVRLALITGAVGAFIPVILFLLFKWGLLHSVPYPLFLIICPPLVLTFRDWFPTDLQIFEQLAEVALLNGAIYFVFGTILAAVFGAVRGALKMDA
jgi:hypothetical protein